MKALLLLFLLFVSPALPATEVFLARCTEVIDGDTIEAVKADGSGIRIRIEGIDCPEGNQAFGDKATDFAREQLLGKDLTVISKTTDRFGRLVARVYVGDRDYSIAAVKAGMAWHFKRYSSDWLLAAFEREARARRVGLWGLADPVAPWMFRKRAAAAGK